MLFDVDGTLVDTNYLHAVTWWQAFAQGGHFVPMANIHRAIGMGSDQMLDQLLPADRDKDADTGLRMSHDALYATYWTRLRPLPGAVELLRACKARGLAVVLASSAGEAESGVLRAALDAEDAIDDATFSGDVERTKPAPDLVQVALEKAAVPAGQAVFVGDTVWDVQASQKAGVPCIGLLSGGIGRQELADAGAAQIYADPGGLLAALPGSLLGRPAFPPQSGPPSYPVRGGLCVFRHGGWDQPDKPGAGTGGRHRRVGLAMHEKRDVAGVLAAEQSRRQVAGDPFGCQVASDRRRRPAEGTWRG